MIIPPIEPETVFFGLMLVANFIPPINFPTKYAEISTIIAKKTIKNK